MSILQVAGETLQPPRPLPWYSNKLAWHMSFSRGQLRKLPILAEIHELLKRENEAGSITRQEAVSMVPPLFLDVEPHHRVSAATHTWCCRAALSFLLTLILPCIQILDMCAAPGSKTAQILEMLHAGTMMPTGMVAPVSQMHVHQQQSKATLIVLTCNQSLQLVACLGRKLCLTTLHLLFQLFVAMRLML